MNYVQEFVSVITLIILFFFLDKEYQNHSSIIRSALKTAVHDASTRLLFIFIHRNFFMNLPAGSILAISPPTGNPQPVLMVDSSTSPRLSFYLCRSPCRRVPEREVAKFAFVVPIYSYLV